MKRFILAASLSITVALLLAACGGDNGGKAGHYENAELGFAFDYPEHWKQGSETMSMTIRLGSGPDTVAFVAVGEDMGEGQLHGMALQVNLNSLETETEISEAISRVDDYFAQVAGAAGGALRESEPAELAGLQAKRIIVDFPYEGTVPSTSEQLLALSPGLSFQFVCEAPRERFAEIHTGCQMVIDSFEFTSGR